MMDVAEEEEDVEDVSSMSFLMAGEAACAVPVGQKPPKFVRPARRDDKKAKAAKRVQPADVPRHPPAPPTPDAAGRTPLLVGGEPLATDEQYSENEKSLSDFLVLHPMLSLDSTGARSLQLMANLLDETAVPVQEVEVIGKAHDDKFLRPPLVSGGERPCVLADRCICRWLAIFRYGADSPLAFVCREFLTPSQLRKFEAEEALPARRGKCLLCTRYLLVRARAARPRAARPLIARRVRRITFTFSLATTTPSAPRASSSSMLLATSCAPTARSTPP